MSQISPPVRVFALLAGLAAATMGLYLTVLARPAADPEPVALAQPPVTKPVQQPAPAAKAAPVAKPKPALAPKPASGFPAAVDRALAEHRVVVVALTVPGAEVDALTAAEAKAGASRAGAGFVRLDVTQEPVARTLLAKLGNAAAEASVLVVSRPGRVDLELAGFADRDTVAQAAASAS